MELHVSQINCYNTCPRMYYFQYLRKLKPIVTDKKLVLGTGIHVGLEEFYRDNMRNPVLAIEAFNLWYQEELNKLDTEEQKTAMTDIKNLGSAMLLNYFKWAAVNDDFVTIQTEPLFELNIAPDLVFAGRFDGIAKDSYNNLWLLEHKTCAQFPSETELRLNTQAGYYLLAANWLNRPKKVVGIIYTMLRKTDPTRAKTPVIRRFQTLRNTQELDKLHERLRYMHRKIESDYHFEPLPGMHCAWQCAYKRLCIALEDGSDTNYLENLLYTTEERRNNQDGKTSGNPQGWAEDSIY